MFLELNRQEFDTVLAALRLWQRTVAERRDMGPEMEIASERGPCLSNNQIDTLCERINVEAPADLDPLKNLETLAGYMIEAHGDAGEYEDSHGGDASHPGEAPEACSYCNAVDAARLTLAAFGRNADHLTP